MAAGIDCSTAASYPWLGPVMHHNAGDSVLHPTQKFAPYLLAPSLVIPSQHPRPLSACELFVFNVDPLCSEEQIKEHFGRYGRIESCVIFKTRRQTAPVAMLSYLDPMSVDMVQASRPHRLGERVVITRRQVPHVDFRSPEALITTKRLLISGLRRDIGSINLGNDEASLKPEAVSSSSSDVQKYFGKLGIIENVIIIHQETAGAYPPVMLVFADYDSVDKIILTQPHIIHGKEVELKKVLLVRGRMATEFKRKHQFPDDITLMTDYQLKIIGEQGMLIEDNYFTEPAGSNFGVNTSSTMGLAAASSLALNQYNTPGASSHSMMNAARHSSLQTMNSVLSMSSTGWGAGPATTSRIMLHQHPSNYISNVTDRGQLNSAIPVFSSSGVWANIQMYQLRQLLIANLSYDTKEEKICEYFQTWGEIEAVSIIKDSLGSSCGYGFILYKNPDSVDKAQSWRPHLMDGQFLETRRMVRKEDAGRPEGSLSSKRLYAEFVDVDEEDLRTYMSQFGELEDCIYFTDRLQKFPEFTARNPNCVRSCASMCPASVAAAYKQYSSTSAGEACNAHQPSAPTASETTQSHPANETRTSQQMDPPPLSENLSNGQLGGHTPIVPEMMVAAASKQVALEESELCNKKDFSIIFFEDHDAVDKLTLMKYHMIDGKLVQVRKSYTPSEMKRHATSFRQTADNSMINLIHNLKKFV